MRAKNKVIGIKARRAALARRCADHSTMNMTRGMSHTIFPQNTARRELHPRLRAKLVDSPLVEAASDEDILAYTMGLDPSSAEWGSAA